MPTPNRGASSPAFIATLENKIRKVLHDASQLRTLDALSSAKKVIKTAQMIVSTYEDRSIDDDLPLVLQFVFLMFSKDGEVDILELAKSVKELEDSVISANGTFFQRSSLAGVLTGVFPDSEWRDVDRRVTNQSDPPAGSISNGIIPHKRRRTTIDAYLVTETPSFKIGDRVSEKSYR
jgi:hypothetical protein